uniref:Integrin alpha FG-GAP repeat containing 2 n=1 Tax=Ciona savignyi TaxID=51511 RepID=H2Y6M6_CIOSA
MRSVSFVNSLKLKVNGKVKQGCIALGDVDGDGCSELVVADEGGLVQIYKGSSAKPWWKSSNFINVGCVVVAVVCNEGRKSVVVFGIDGSYSIIDFNQRGGAVPAAIRSDWVLPNIMNVVVGDLDCDGLNEVVACHSDHCVSAYRWNVKHKRLVRLQRWKLRHLAGNISVHVGSDEGVPSIIVSQPGCSYAVLLINWNQNDTNKSDETMATVKYTPLSSQSRSQNPTITCQILGDITKSSSSPAGYFALCTLDGTIKLMEDDEILWSFQVDHQLFALHKLDILGDKREEVIVCARDGLTYIVDHDRNVVRYQFPDNVQDHPCLVYSDFHNHIWLFYDVRLPFLKATDLVTLAESDREMTQLFAQLGAATLEEKRGLLGKCTKIFHQDAKLDRKVEVVPEHPAEMKP